MNDPAVEDVAALCWWSPLGNYIGAVLLWNESEGWWKAYLGTARGTDETVDALTIARRGARLAPGIARAMTTDARLIRVMDNLLHLA